MLVARSVLMRYSFVDVVLQQQFYVKLLQKQNRLTLGLYVVSRLDTTRKLAQEIAPTLIQRFTSLLFDL